MKTFNLTTTASLAFLLTACVSKSGKEPIIVINNPVPVQLGDPFILNASDGR